MRTILLWFLSLLSCSVASLLAIDYGGEWIKASVIKPGVPFDVLLNRDSKRKVQSSVAWKGDERLFGGDAFSLTSRFPSDAFSFIKLVQGRHFKSDSHVSFFDSISESTLIPTSRDTVAFLRSPSSGKTSADREWSSEELIAMQLSYIKDLADSLPSSTPSDKVRDVIMTIPAFYTQTERQALADAVDIAGLKLLGFVHDGTAVAVNYAMTRTISSEKEKEWHVIYDAGATSITATVVGFSSYSSSKKLAQAGVDVQVLATSYDRNATGLELDRRMRDMLVLSFNIQHASKGVDIREDKKGMAKMLKEAMRVKGILSANNEVISRVESVSNDIDFRATISRAEFEAACKNLQNRFAEPILDAIEKSGLKLSDIQSVIMVGGVSRIPMVQAAVKAAVGSSLPGTPVNADESFVLGAALYGSSLSRQLKSSKELRVTDVLDLTGSLFESGEGDSGSVVLSYPAAIGERTIRTPVFVRGSKLGAKKTVTIKRPMDSEDFTITIGYRKNTDAKTTDILNIHLTNVSSALATMSSRLTPASTSSDSIAATPTAEPVVQLTVELDKDGFVRVPEAIVWGDVKEPKAEGAFEKLKGMFKGKDKSSSTDETEEESSSDSSEFSTLPASSTSGSTSATTSSSASVEEDVEKTATSLSSSSTASSTPTLSAKQLSRIKLSMEVEYAGIRPLTSSEKRKSRDRLISLDTQELLRQRASEARNSLEGYLYRLRELLSEDSITATTPFMDCSNVEERAKIAEAMEETFAWMSSDDAESAGYYEIRDKREQLERHEKPIQLRYSEREAFPESLSDLQQAHWATRMFLQSAAENATADAEKGLPEKYTKQELEDLTLKLKDSETWLNEGVEKTKAIKRCGDSDPFILTAEMKARGTSLQREVMRLLKRKTPKRTSIASSTTSTEAPPSSSVPPTVTDGSDFTRETTTVEDHHTRDEL